MGGAVLECPYELVELIGQGGMGQVFLARHTGLGRMEALKVLAPKLAKDSEFVGRLRREARATTMLTHPNIVSVYGFGRLDDGRYYLAMEYLAGETLEAWIDRVGALPGPRCLRLLYQLASAMAHAHAHEVVHRDIKPANLMVIAQDTETPNLKVLDFGLAKIVNPNYAESMAVSKAGSFYGTPGYMAPERVRGVTSDPRIDIYSFGCVAYTLMTGRAPFVGRGLDVLHAHQDRNPERPSSHSEVNHELEAIVMRCLEKEPSQRYANGEELAAALSCISNFNAEDARRKTLTRVSETIHAELADTMRSDPPVVQHTLVDVPEALPLANTQELYPRRAEISYQVELFQLAESLVDAGCRDVDLMVCITNVYDARNALLDHDARLSELLRQREHMEQSFRQKESVLRFALADLSLELSEGVDAEQRAAIEGKANQLTEQLSRAEHLYQRDLQVVLDEEINQASARHTVAERQRLNHTELLHIVDSNLETLQMSDELQARLQTFQEAKQRFEDFVRASAS